MFRTNPTNAPFALNPSQLLETLNPTGSLDKKQTYRDSQNKEDISLLHVCALTNKHGHN